MLLRGKGENHEWWEGNRKLSDGMEKMYQNMYEIVVLIKKLYKNKTNCFI